MAAMSIAMTYGLSQRELLIGVWKASCLASRNGWWFISSVRQPSVRPLAFLSHRSPAISAVVPRPRLQPTAPHVGQAKCLTRHSSPGLSDRTGPTLESRTSLPASGSPAGAPLAVPVAYNAPMLPHPDG